MRLRSLVVALAAMMMLPTSAAVAAGPPLTTDEVVQRALQAAPAHKPGHHGAEAKVEAGNKATLTIVEGVDVSVTPLGNTSRSYVRPDGVQALAVLDKGNKALFVVDIPSGMTLASDGGGYKLVAPGPEGDVVLAEIEAPWAVDAKGKQLPTSYSLNPGGVLTQTIDTDGATYPIVADPYLASKWYGVQIRFTLTETRRMALGSSGVAVVAAYVPPPWGQAIAAASGAMSVWSNAALSYNNCVAVNATYWGGFYPWYWNC